MDREQVAMEALKSHLTKHQLRSLECWGNFPVLGKDGKVYLVWADQDRRHTGRIVVRTKDLPSGSCPLTTLTMLHYFIPQVACTVESIRRRHSPSDLGWRQFSTWTEWRRSFYGTNAPYRDIPVTFPYPAGDHALANKLLLETEPRTILRQACRAETVLLAPQRFPASYDGR